MENFSAKIYRTSKTGSNLYMEFWPENLELQEKVMHGHTSEISGNIADTIAAYEPIAAREMMLAVDRIYPNSYVLDAKYDSR